MLKVKHIEQRLLELAVVFTVLSFSPNNTVQRVSSLLMLAFWGLSFFFLLKQRYIRIGTYARIMIGFYIFWYVLTVILFWTGEYRSTGLGVVSFLPYCIIFCVIGNNMWLKEGISVENLCYAVVIGEVGLLLSLAPMVPVLRTEYYLFGAKNQMGQILGLGILVEVFLIAVYTHSPIVRYLMYLLGVGSFMMLATIRSRTPIASVTVVFIIDFVMKKNKTQKNYLYISVIVLISAIAVYLLGGMDFIRSMFTNDMNSTERDFNTFTSGRGDLFVQSFQEFLGKPFFGLGAYAYVDNFVINAMRCGGLALLLTLVPIAYGILFNNIIKSGRLLSQNGLNRGTEILFITLRYFCIYYFCVSLMEGYPPFGPKTSVFMLWLLIGMAETEARNRQ